MGHRGRQPAGDVVGHVTAADRHRIGKNQIAVKKHPDRRRPAAHVDHRHAEVDLVLDQAREAGGVGADDQRLDVEVRAPDRRAVIAHPGGCSGHHVHVDAEPLAIHAARVANAAALVDREPDRHRVNDLAVARLAQQIALIEHALQFDLADLAPGNADLGLDDARGREPARQIGHHLLDGFLGHFLGCVHRVDDRGSGRFEIDDRAVAQAARDLVSDADDLRLVGLDPGDEAAHLGGADIERGDQAAMRPMTWFGRSHHPPRLALGALGGWRGLPGIGFARPHLVDRGHVFFAGRRPFLAIGASFGGSGATRTTNRSGRRMSIAWTLR